MSGAQRDRTTVRRALLAGALTSTVTGLPLLVAAVVGGQGGAVGLATVLLALTLGGMVASAWLLLGSILDVRAGERPGTRRLVWTAALVGVTLLSPLLLVAARG